MTVEPIDGTAVYQEQMKGKDFRLDEDGKPQITADSTLTQLDSNRTGHAGEQIITDDSARSGWERVNGEHTNLTDYQGQHGLDGVYRRGVFILFLLRVGRAQQKVYTKTNWGD